MPSYMSPGVYVKEVSQISRPVEGVNTSITAFVGLVHQGPIGEPILVDSFSEYVTRFSEIIDENDSMGLAVQLFFLNGGLSAYICAISNDESNSNDGNPIPSVSDYILFYDQKLKTVPDISIIVVPGISWDGGTGQSILSATLAHCQSMQNRFLKTETEFL